MSIGLTALSRLTRDHYDTSFGISGIACCVALLYAIAFGSGVTFIYSTEIERKHPGFLRRKGKEVGEGYKKEMLAGFTQFQQLLIKADAIMMKPDDFMTDDDDFMIKHHVIIIEV